MAPTNPAQAEALLQQGMSALKAGDKLRARSLLIQAIQLNSGDERGWLWLSGAVDTDEQRRECLRRALVVNPNSAVARAGMARLDQQANTGALPPAPAAALRPPIAPTQPLNPGAQQSGTGAMNRAPTAPLKPPIAPTQPLNPGVIQHAPTPQTLGTGAIHRAPTTATTPAEPKITPLPPPIINDDPASTSTLVDTLREGVKAAPQRPAQQHPRWLIPALVGGVCLLVLLIAITMFLLLAPANNPAQATVATAAATASPTPEQQTTPTVAASEAIAKQLLTIEDQGVELSFPDSASFNARVSSKAGVARVVLEYGSDKLTCGTVVARAFPQFTPGERVDVSWNWLMRESGSEPPGAAIWYRWRAIGRDGTETVSDEARVTWLDATHDWQQLSRNQVTLHWYGSSPAFGRELLDTAVAALDELDRSTGITLQEPVQLYIYADSEDMRAAVLYEPGWTGGLAYSSHSIVIIGINEQQLDWGKRTIAHELTHVLVGHRVFSCVAQVPTWLNEGIAVYGEGGLDQYSNEQLQQAIAADELFSLRALSGGFSEHPDQADLSYSQSYSVVNYLVTSQGSNKLLALFDQIQRGVPTEQALIAAYGFGLDGLEDRWRESLGLQARSSSAATPTAAAQPTPIPTIRPISPQ